MRIAVIGGGPGGLYFSILAKHIDPSNDVVVYERNRPDDAYGFGVVFSDRTGHGLAEAEPATFEAMADRFARWDDIDVHYRGEVLASTGHGFSGLSRRGLLQILTRRAASLGVELCFEQEITAPETLEADLIVAADGSSSVTRDRYADHFEPTLDWRPNRFVWLGTTRPFPAFTFYFKNDEHGLWRVHAYQYDGGHSTFIVEATEATWRAARLDETDEAGTIAFCERLFAEELDGHGLVGNGSIWRRFPTVHNRRWSHRPPNAPLVLLGDAAHTAHFSIGSGTKMAMEDAIALAGTLAASDRKAGGASSDRTGAGPYGGDGARDTIRDALIAYEKERRPVVESLQRAAQVSLEWFEDTERYMGMEPLRFAFSLLTRSLRLTHHNLRERDPAFVTRVDRVFACDAERQSGLAVMRGAETQGTAAQGTTARPPPPLFTPFRVRDLVLENRVVVSPMCQYSAQDGTPGDWHLVHLASRAIGGAGLVMAEMTDVGREARISPGCTGLYKREHVTAWKRIVDFVHRHSRAKLGIQLGHAGRKAATRLAWEGDNEPLEQCGWEVLAPSPLPYFPHSPVPRQMQRRDMEQTLDDYVRAAHLAEEAGFDWLELHCAHGYLLATFISPLTNRRDDQYGGPLENRMRYPLEVFDAIRSAWPAHKPMSVRISAVDWMPGGIDSAEAVEIARQFKQHGVDIIDVSAGQTVPDQKPVYGRLFQTPFSDRIRHEAGIPTMAVGNISSYTDVNTILAAGRADLCLLARMHLWDPYWTRHAAYAMDHDLPWPPQYSTLDRFKARFTPEGGAF